MKSLLATIGAAIVALTVSSLAWASQPLLSPNELDAIRTSVRIIDIRSPDAYADGHIPGAVSAPYAQWRGPADNPGKLPTIEHLTGLVRSLGVDRDSHVVVVSTGSDTTDFGASARVYWTLKYLGLADLSILNGGQKAWGDAGLPQGKDLVRVDPSTFEASLNEDIIATTAQVESQLDEPNVRLVDARPLDFYLGKAKAPTAQAPGTIKGAINLENHRWFEPGTSIFVSTEQARKLAAELLPDQSASETISFCNTGHWAATDWFALSEILGQENIRLYPESMAEWSQDASRPMDNVPGRGAQILDKLKGVFGLILG